jgi:hypothetical protein
MKNILPIVLCLLMLPVQACSTKVEIADNSPTPELIEPVVMPSATLKPAATVQDELLIDACIELKPDHTLQAAGFLLLQDDSGDTNNLMNLTTMAITKIPEQAGSVYLPIVSPDGKHLIGEVCAEDCNYVLRTPDRIVNTIASQKDWVMRQWLDNERVIILTLHQPHDVLILNPFTGDIEKLSLSLNDPFTISRGPEESLIPVNLDKSLSKALYYDEHAEGRLILWDISEAKELVTLPYTVNPSVAFNGYSWSPDGKTYITVAPNNVSSNALYSLNINGELTKLTDYDQEYLLANITYPVWSPDNRHIAFWLKVAKTSSEKPDELSQYLAVMDTLNLETKIYCQTFGNPFYPAFPMHWSPDGLQLITNTRTERGAVEPVLIDLVHLTKTNINTQGSWVEGWLSPE